MKTVAFVPIRLNSKRVVGKNLRPLGGRPLMCWVLETLAQVKGIDKVYAYCSDRRIEEYLPQGVAFLERPERLDSDDTLGKDIYDTFVQTVKADIYLLAHTTSPFLRCDTVENALAKVQSGAYDSAFAAAKQQTFAWYQGQPLNYDPTEIPRTQTIDPVIVETSAFYIFRSELWREHRRRIGFHPYMAFTDRIESVDIDWPDDFALAEYIASAMLSEKK